MFVWEKLDWPHWRYDASALATVLASVRHSQGRLLGRMEGLGFALRDQATLQVLTEDVLKTSEIEGQQLNPDVVRSSIARHLGGISARWFLLIDTWMVSLKWYWMQRVVLRNP